MTSEATGWSWWIANWPRAGLMTATFLIATLLAVLNLLPVAPAAVIVLLACYLVHQFEEHARGRFETEINDLLAGGEPLLTPVSIFWINLLAVELLLVLVLFASARLNPGFGLVGAWLVVVNAVLHIAIAARTRRANAGLISAVVLFLPVGIVVLVMLSRDNPAAFGFHVLGLLIAIAVHALLVAWVLLRRGLMAQSRFDEYPALPSGE